LANDRAAPAAIIEPADDRAGMWRFSREEIRVHAIACAMVAWIAIATCGLLVDRAPAWMGPVVESDFVHFYTLAALGARHDASPLVDDRSMHEAQVALLPSTDHLWYPVRYPPWTTAALSPLASATFQAAWWMLGAFTVAVVVVTARQLTREPRWVLPIVLAFPPLWIDVLNGQLGVIPFLAFALAGAAWVRGQALVTGCALALLLFKPQYVPPTLLIGLLAREWRLLSGWALGAAAIVGLAVMHFGLHSVFEYLRHVPVMLADAIPGEPRPFLQHSIRVMTSMTPLPTLAFVTAAATVGGLLWRAWGTGVRSLQMSGLVLASLLLSPHTFVYDLPALLLPGLWLGLPGAPVGYLFFASLILPIAFKAPLPVGTCILMLWLWRLGSPRAALSFAPAAPRPQPALALANAQSSACG
jgi:hypothetical protein